MNLRHQKSIKKLSSLFSQSNTGKRTDSSPTHLIWILLSSASRGPQCADLYNTNVIRLAKAISTEKGVRSVFQLKNTSPSCTLSGSTASSPKGSPVSLLVNVQGEECFRTTLQKLRGLLEYGQIAKDTSGNTILHWTLSTYALTQDHSPRRAQKITSNCVVTVIIEPSLGQYEDIDSWYRKEHLAMVSKNRLFLRCRRYVRILDPSTVDQSQSACAAKFLAVHEYTSVQDLLDHSIQKGQIVEETEWTRRVMEGAKAVERTVWTVC